jgi:hypothetical protein
VGGRCDGWQPCACANRTQSHQEFASIHFFPFLLGPTGDAGLPTREDFRFGHFPDHHFDLPNWLIAGFNRGDQYVTGVKDTHMDRIADLQASTFQNMARNAQSSAISPPTKLRRHTYLPGLYIGYQWQIAVSDAAASDMRDCHRGDDGSGSCFESGVAGQ